MKLGAPVSVGKYIVHNMIPVAIGNTIAGVVLFHCLGSPPMRVHSCKAMMSTKTYYDDLKQSGTALVLLGCSSCGVSLPVRWVLRRDRSCQLSPQRADFRDTCCIALRGSDHGPAFNLVRRELAFETLAALHSGALFVALPYALLYGTVTMRISSWVLRLKSGDTAVLPSLKHKVLQPMLADSCHSCSYDADIHAAHDAW